jgi:hypothetical protein
MRTHVEQVVEEVRSMSSKYEDTSRACRAGGRGGQVEQVVEEVRSMSSHSLA